MEDPGQLLRIEAALTLWPPQPKTNELCNWRYTCERTGRMFNIRELALPTALRARTLPGGGQRRVKPATRVVFFVEEYIPTGLLRHDTTEGVRYEHCDEILALFQQQAPNAFFAQAVAAGLDPDAVICAGAELRSWQRSGYARSIRECLPRIVEAIESNTWLRADTLRCGE